MIRFVFYISWYFIKEWVDWKVSNDGGNKSNCLDIL